VVHYDINGQGFRGTEFTGKADEYRILAVGGSTTESLDIDEPKSWPWLLERSLATTPTGQAVRVANVGVSGMTARDHVVQVKRLTDEYPPIHEILVLVGVNDMSDFLANADEYGPPPPVTEPRAERKQERKAFQVPGGFRRLAVWQLLSRTKQLLLRKFSKSGAFRDDDAENYARWRRNRRGVTILDSLPDLTPALVDYRRNLNLIVDHARAHSARLLLMTQPSLWRPDLTPAEANLLWLGGVGDFLDHPVGKYYSANAMSRALDQFNAVTLAVCRERGVTCLDLASKIPKTGEMFFDDVHYTEAGSARVAQEVAEFLRAQEPFR
jgi:lysophospholipase L1-like esterase